MKSKDKTQITDPQPNQTPKKQHNNNNAKQGLNQLKNESAAELGVQFSEYNGDLSSRQCGSVGGEMVKKMVESYKNKR